MASGFAEMASAPISTNRETSTEAPIRQTTPDRKGRALGVAGFIYALQHLSHGTVLILLSGRGAPLKQHLT